VRKPHSRDDKIREGARNGFTSRDYKRALASASLNALLIFLIVLPMSPPSLADLYLALRAAAMVFIYKLAVELNIALVSLNDVKRALGGGRNSEGGGSERNRRRE